MKLSIKAAHFFYFGQSFSLCGHEAYLIQTCPYPCVIEQQTMEHVERGLVKKKREAAHIKQSVTICACLQIVAVLFILFFSTMER